MARDLGTRVRPSTDGYAAGMSWRAVRAEGQRGIALRESAMLLCENTAISLHTMDALVEHMRLLRTEARATRARARLLRRTTSQLGNVSRSR